MNTSLPPPDSDSPSKSRRLKQRQLLLKIVAWISAVFTVLFLIVTVALVALLNSTRVHNYLLDTLQKQASDSLGVRARLQNFTVHLSSLSVDLYGLTVDGANPYPNPPVLQVRHAQAGIRVVSILQRSWYLNSVQIDNPVVQIFVDDRGVSNIPKLKSHGNTGNNTSVFDLGIRHAVLDHGEVYYNNQPSSLAVDLHDLKFRASFNSLLQKYSGRLGYADGHLTYGSVRPLSHNLDLEFDATPTTFHLTRARVTGGASSIALSATVNNYDHPLVQAQYDALVDGAQMAEVLHNSSVPVGLIRAIGSMQYQQAANRSILESLAVNGQLTSRQLTVRTPSVRAEINNLAAHYSLANGQAALRDFRANLLGGALTANGTMTNLGGDSHSQMTAVLHGVSLAQVRQALGRTAAPAGISLTGALNASATAAWGKTLADLVVHTDATINGQVTRAHAVKQTPGSGVVNASGATAAPAAISVESAIHAVYTARNHQLALIKSYLRTPQTDVTMDGVVGDRSSLVLRLQANDLREVSTIVDLFRMPSPGHSLQPLDLSGTVSFQGSIQGSTASPHLTGQLTALNLSVNGTAWKVLRAGIDANPSQINLQNADLEPASRGRITFNADVGLTRWSFTNNSPVRVQLNASQMNIADLAKLTGQQIPVAGILNANVNIHGSELNPVGDGNLSLTRMTAYEEPVNSVKLKFSGTGDEAHGDLVIQLPAGDIQSNVSIRPKQRTYTAQLTSSGIRLDKLQALKAKNIDAVGMLALNAKGQGSFDNPQLNATIQIPSLTIRNQKITGINLQMNVAEHVANATLSSSAANTSIQAKARVILSGDYLADASLDTQGIPLQPLLATYAPGQAISGQTELHATLHGPLKNRNLLEAHVTIPVLKMAYNNNIQLAAVAPIHIDYKNGVIELQRTAIRGTDMDLQLQGSIPTYGGGKMSLLLLGTVNLQLAQLFSPDVISSGELKFHINSYGASSGPSLGGEIDIVDANFASGNMPVGLQHGNGILTLTNERINISKFQGTVGGGTVTAQGGVAYRPGVQFDLGLAAKGIRILYPQGMRESVDANLRLAGSTENAVLGGSVNIADLSFTPAFDLSSFIRQFSGGVISPPSRGFGQNLQLNLAVHSTNNVNLVSRTLSMNGSANLQVRGTASQPVILGRVNLTGGDIIMNGDRFLLTGGTVQFVNPSETQPVVNLTLSTTIQQYNINLRFNGPVDQLRTQYSSDPALPSADIINLLAFGQTTEAAANSATPADQAAESLVASQVSSQVTSRVSKIAGISQLSINPVLAGSSSQGPPGANITIQQRVTGNLFVTFSTNVASTQSQTIQGQYQLSPRVAVSATRDPNGGFAVDTLIKKTW